MITKEDLPITNKESIIKFINDKLKDYEGYVQFSHRPIEEKDIFNDGKEVKVEDEKGFIYEANFYKEAQSISIRQINENWYVDVTNTSKAEEIDKNIYLTKYGVSVKMAQIWEADDKDPLCANMPVKKLKKVVFAGFEGEKS